MKSLESHKSYKYLIIDTMNIAYQSYAGLKLATKSGKPTGMQYGVLTFYNRMRKYYPTSELIFLWEGRNSWRKKKYPIYKSKRRMYKTDPWFTKSLQETQEMLTYLECRICRLPEYEADDVARYLHQLYQDSNKLLVSKDHDWLVMVDSHTDVMRGKHVLVEADIEKELGFAPRKMVLYMILTGDASDSISGIPGFRKQIAQEMCASGDVVSLDDIIPWLTDHGYYTWARKVSEHWWILERNLDLIYTYVDDLPIDNLECTSTVLNKVRMLEFVDRNEFKSLRNLYVNIAD